MSRKDHEEPASRQGGLDGRRVPVGRAKTSRLPGSGQGLKKELVLDSGLNSFEVFAHYDHDSSWWKTCQVSLLTMQWDEYSETWPSVGMMQNGKCYLLLRSELPISGKGYGLWPTPRHNDAEKRGEIANDPRNGLPAAAKYWPTPRSSCRDMATMEMSRYSGQQRQAGKPEAQYRPMTFPTPSASSREGTKSGGHPGLAGVSGNRQKFYKMLGKEEGKKLGCQSLNPYWVEWLMGFPLAWTDLKD